MANLKANKKMIKKLLFLIAITFATSINALASVIDTSETEGLTPFDWTPISDVDKIMQYENQKKLTKRSITQAKLGAENYSTAVSLMENKEYVAAIKEFKSAMKRYKRAKISADGMNFIHVNMALSYSNSGNKEDLAQAERFLSLLTSKVYDDNKWAYNVAIANYLIGKEDEAASLLSSLVRKDNLYFQAYITLEAIYRNSGNEEDADKVLERMYTAKEKLKNKKVKSKKQRKNKKDRKNDKVISKGERPDVTNLKIVKNDDHLQFNKTSAIDERKMAQIQEGISNYNQGVQDLSKRKPKTAQKTLKDAEKKLKRGKINDDGLNFARGNLAIACLATGERSGVGQAKRYLAALTSKLYSTRPWSYNMAVAYYEFAFKSARENKREGTRNWQTPAAKESLKQSIKLFKKSINQDKLFLPAYENLIYIYNEQEGYKQAESIGNALNKAKAKLMQSFSKEEQIAQGGGAYIFRLNLGTFGSFDTPVNLFDEENVIAIPMSEQTTAYVSGLFYSVDDALNYQEKMKNKGYLKCFIVAYKDGKQFTEF